MREDFSEVILAFLRGLRGKLPAGFIVCTACDNCLTYHGSAYYSGKNESMDPSVTEDHCARSTEHTVGVPSL